MMPMLHRRTEVEREPVRDFAQRSRRSAGSSRGEPGSRPDLAVLSRRRDGVVFRGRRRRGSPSTISWYGGPDRLIGFGVPESDGLVLAAGQDVRPWS